MFLSGTWFGVAPRTNMLSQQRLDYVFAIWLITILGSIVNMSKETLYDHLNEYRILFTLNYSTYDIHIGSENHEERI